MPRRNEIEKIVILGAGPIIIGQACEFDYSGTQGVKALREEGYEVILVNSNPATIMTDPELVKRTYIEALDWKVVTAILKRERPQALLPTLGGQVALNIALKLEKEGVLRDLYIEMLGVSPQSIEKAEDRALFKASMEKIGLTCPKAMVVHSFQEACAAVSEIGFPMILRPSFTLGGSGGGIVQHRGEFEEKVKWALSQSPVSQLLVEESVIGWKEFELEVMCDRAGNFIVVCTIESLDPMGVHTGDSITVVPAMTLTDREYQKLRDAAVAIVKEVGLESGGANVQFAVSPHDGLMHVIEMNPRVSRSSALASKATGYPVAKIAAKLAVGFTLDELQNDITKTSAAFEPTLDYVVVKWPRFAFEKFPGADTTLGTQMKSVGEVMGIGRTFPEALQKAARSLEIGKDGLVSLLNEWGNSFAPKEQKGAVDAAVAGDVQSPSSEHLEKQEELKARLRELVSIPSASRLFYVGDAMRMEFTDAELVSLTHIDPWFLKQIRRIIEVEACVRASSLSEYWMRECKRLGFSDRQLALLLQKDEEEIRALRKQQGITPVYHKVDTCAAEFVAHTPYLYSTYETESEAAPQDNKKKIVILGGGPNRIGQGIEFDYCCVHAVQSLRELGFETVMINCNPETVSTDYDTADRLYFEPLSLEDVLGILEEEKPQGVIVQFGGQTPLKLAVPLEKRGVKLLGTGADAIDRAEDRERFEALLNKLSLHRPNNGIARTVQEAVEVAESIGYPVLVRPSYVLGGRAMTITYTREELVNFARDAVEVARDVGSSTILVDEFLRDAIEVDVDCISDCKRVVIGGVLQHIEEAGIHSGDSSVVIPPYSLSPEIVLSLEEQSRMLALELGVVGLVNVQFAIKGGKIYVLEVNPRASRTIPFVSKATGLPLAKIAAKLMVGCTLDDLGIHDTPLPRHVAVKQSVFPFAKFSGTDIILGPEMRSTGEVMGISNTFARAFGKAMSASGLEIALSLTPNQPRVAFISVKDEDKPVACIIARRLRALGFNIYATRGTCAALERARVPVELIRKVNEGSPHLLDAIQSGQIALVINTTLGAKEVRDSYSLRRYTLLANIPYFTTIAAALAACDALEAVKDDAEIHVYSLHEWLCI
ncbi:carbamoyl-phosphate synthase large subunit [Pajaroellobacter abortibovis]|uniref:Carbamoyl phosphate synthase large chain n=1 Tax=Pajaroellobacter abortibovis TaxID=1882918 RepID=A0A1L6MZV2_9BACT|nr:carbamoyl-phosphate synthase large subunit [Pajaroellobacter abortibovis]APS00937.1 carbamoyl phosphate synthase large subunit [Pajaroellobacter abortibovis]